LRTTKRRIDPLVDIGSRLLSVAKPARYLGGEVGALPPWTEDGSLTMGLCFPDLYEIGMSNNAIRILYNELNARQAIRCERVFAPAPDFEALLKELGLPLYTLESGLALDSLDILGFTLGYELAASSLLAVLESGHVPLERKDRTDGDPIVIMGGPAISNPHPFGDFVDACYIGEAEASFFGLMDRLAGIKQAGGSRDALLSAMAADRSIWFPLDSPHRAEAAEAQGREKALASRAVYNGFDSKVYRTGTPIATLKAVQDHGTVEIMRGCPNGCRFCHAGYYYRPQRTKSLSAIREEVKELVEEGGYREITLASLSSGDYPDIGGLLDTLNAEWSGLGVSFQLPSLKISSFNLPLIEKISEVRKSGLTFAVETPNDAWQRIINKDVSFEQTASILEEARGRGFKQAKFYFMIGLPVPGGAEAEADAIIAFFERIHARVPFQLNVNIGTFVPKAHTPFQWARQLTEDESLAAVRKIKDGLRRLGAIKISYHSPFVSLLEGVISRGDSRVGGLLLAAYRKGARLDAWDEHFDRELWREVLTAADWDVIGEVSRERPVGAPLPWDDISIGVGKKYLQREYSKALAGELTSCCMENCTEPCGACNDTTGIVRNSGQVVVEERPLAPEPKAVARLSFLFTKEGPARFLPHLALVEAFSRAFQTSGLPVLFSAGFNPMPRLELVQPLPIGIASAGEAASVLLRESLLAGAKDSDPINAWIGRLNSRLPQGMRVVEAAEHPITEGKKIHSLNGLSWGSRFLMTANTGSGGLAADLEKLAGAMSARLVELDIPGASAKAVDGRLVVTLPDANGKDRSLLRILESLLGGDPSLDPVQGRFTIVREACLAKAGDKSGISFLEAFSIVG
jgi:radical SAM family uncharacterized protein/radical SAM-linked protein